MGKDVEGNGRGLIRSTWLDENKDHRITSVTYTVVRAKA
jgi:hypothetical protein